MKGKRTMKGADLEADVIDRIQNRAELAIRQEDIKKVVQATRDSLNLPYGTSLLRVTGEKTEDWAVKGEKIKLTVECDKNDETLLALSHMSGGIVIFGVSEYDEPTDLERIAEENENAESEGDDSGDDSGDGVQEEITDGAGEDSEDDIERPTRKPRKPRKLAGRVKKRSAR